MLLATLQPTPHQQEKNEHRQGIEVDLAAVQDGVDRSRDAAARESQGNGKIQMCRPGSQRSPRTSKEQTAGPGQRNRCKQHARPAEEPRILRLDSAEGSAVKSKGQGHDIARAGRGDSDSNQEPVFFLTADLSRTDVLSRMGRIAKRIECPRDLRQLYLGGVPTNPNQGAPQIEARFDHSWENSRQFFDQPHAGRAVYPLEIQLDGLPTVRGGTAIEVVKYGLIELLVLAGGCASGLGSRLRFAAQPVVAVKPAAGNHRIDCLTAPTAELLLARRIDQPWRNRQAAMHTTCRLGRWLAQASDTRLSAASLAMVFTAAWTRLPQGLDLLCRVLRGPGFRSAFDGLDRSVHTQGDRQNSQ